MTKNKLETEIGKRAASVVRVERPIAETELSRDNSIYTIHALAALRLTLNGEKQSFLSCGRTSRVSSKAL